MLYQNRSWSYINIHDSTVNVKKHQTTNDEKVAEGRIKSTQGFFFSADEGADVDQDGETPVVEDYGIPARL